MDDDFAAPWPRKFFELVDDIIWRTASNGSFE